MKTKLTEKSVAKLLQSRPPKKKTDYWDTRISGFGLRRFPTGAASYIAGGRFGGTSFARRAAADAHTTTFEDGKRKVVEWLQLSDAGKDPQIVEQERARAAERQRGHAFNAVADDFVAACVDGIQRPKQVPKTKRQIAAMREVWGTKQIHNIKRDDVVLFIQAKRGEARHRHVTARRLFGWAREQAYGLETNVTADIKFSRIVPKPKNNGDDPPPRVLTIDEVRAVWRAAAELGSPSYLACVSPSAQTPSGARSISRPACGRFLGAA